MALELERVLSSLFRDSVSVVIIRSIDEWGSLIRVGPEGLVVVNTHGELVPIPMEYGKDWRAFYSRLAELIRERGWIFVNPVGCGFYFVGNARVEGVGDRYAVGLDGPVYLSVALGRPFLPYQQYAWTGDRFMVLRKSRLSMMGRQVFSALRLSMPEEVDIEWPLLTADQPEWYLYELELENATLYAGVCMRAGKGILCWGGLTARPLEEKISIAVAMVALSLGLPLPRTNQADHGTRWALPLAAVAAVALIVILKHMKRSKKRSKDLMC